MRYLLILLLAFSASAQVVIEGHRGARGYVPENTIPSFIKALELGAETLELDVVVTKDGKLLVSHEPWFSHDIATAPDGTPVDAKNEKDFNIFAMTYAETLRFDVGLRGHHFSRCRFR